MHCELRLQWARPLQAPLDVGAETLNQRKEGGREGVGRQKGEERLGKQRQVQDGFIRGPSPLFSELKPHKCEGKKTSQCQLMALPQREAPS